jgi:lantibiotic modifying enzyme
MMDPATILDHPFPELLDRRISDDRPPAQLTVPGWPEWRRDRLGDVVDILLAQEYRQTSAGRIAFLESVDSSWWGRRHPVADRLRRTIADLADAAAIRLHEHFTADRTALRREWGLAADDDIVEVRPGLGDPHDGGRTVVLVLLASGRRLVYKPRSVRPESVLDDVVRAVAVRTGDPGWEPVRVLDRPDHGWSEFVASERRQDVELFYRRAGVLLAVTTAIGMHDLHSENIIAAADRPIVIDAETVLPAACVGIEPTAWQPSAAAAGRTVLGTGLLPRAVPVFRQRTHVAPDAVVRLGGLDGIRPELEDIRRWRWCGDQLTEVRERRTTAGRDNLPHPPGAGPRNRGAVLAAGFTAAWDALRSDDGSLLRPLLQLPTRVLPRNTSTYAAALKFATKPAALESESARQRALDLRLGGDPAGAVLRAVELAWLHQQDVPRFEAAPDGREVRSGGRPTPVTLVRAPAAQAWARATDLLDRPAAWIDEQVDLIRASFSEVYRTDIESVGPVSDPVDAVGPEVAVTMIANLLRDLRRPDELGTGWLAVHHDELSGTLHPAAAGSGLRSGAGGIALFLAHAGARLQRPDWTAIAAAALHDVVSAARRVADSTLPQSGAPTDVGLDDGLAGAVWVLARCAAPVGRPELLDAAQEIVEVALAQPFSMEQRVDAGGGSAGMLLALTELARRIGSDAAMNRVGASLLSAFLGRPGGLRGMATVTEAWSVVEALARWSAFGGDGGRARATAERLATTLAVRESVVPARGVGQVSARFRAESALRAAGGDTGSELPDTVRVVDDSLARGTAGLLLAKHRLGLPVDAEVSTLAVPPGRLRLVGPDVAPTLVPGLADGLAGVGMALLIATDVTRCRPSPADAGQDPRKDPAG